MYARRSAAALVLALAAAAPAAPAGGEEAPPAAPVPAPGEDVLVLKAGGEIRGRITAEDDEAYAVRVGGTLRLVARADVAEVRRAPAPAGGSGDGPPAPAPGGDGGAGPGPGTPGKEGPARRRPGDGERERRRRPGDPAGGDEGMPPSPGEPAPPPPLSAAAREWAGTCLARVLDPDADPAVRRSAAEAIRALGPAVKPLLEEAKGKAGEEGRNALARLAASLDAPRGVPPGEGGGRRPGEPGERPGAPPPPGGAPERGRSLLERVRTDLGLDEAAARTVGAKLLAFGREMRAALEDARDGLVSYEDARTKVAGLRTSLRDSLAGTLTPEQQAKLDALLDGMGPGRRAERPAK